MPIVLLIDNGSKRPEATLQLRKIASQLGDRAGQVIHPVSLQYTDKISIDVLDGQPAQVFDSFIGTQLKQGESEFIVLPLFFGESRALTSFIPELVQALQSKLGEFRLQIAEPVYPLPQGEPQLAMILHDNVLMTAEHQNMPIKHVVLVDHGSPIPQVTQVRQRVADELQGLFGEFVQVDQAAMERREGRAYDFNGLLLKEWLEQKGKAGLKSAIVSMMFFLPGRHAGAGGDIEEICAHAMRKYPDFKVVITPLVGEHPEFVTILQSRLAHLQA
ncbi:MAG: cobalamin biosynthesis protein CbiX [Gammaproteobacteria bacterium]|nr:MAG: cobalamin biosynthesis protein CbiX [Gammaproteobacteria bacterium]